MNINYETLTAEQIEEHAEFVDWSIMPSHLLTTDIKKRFKDIKKLRARMILEDILSIMTIKADIKKFPNTIFFFVDNELYMFLRLGSKEPKRLEFKQTFVNKLTPCIEMDYSPYNSSSSTFDRFLRNIIHPYFQKAKLRSYMSENSLSSWMESHLRDTDFDMPYLLSLDPPEILEGHFKKITITESTWTSKFINTKNE